jgi:hypothetical protein
MAPDLASARTQLRRAAPAAAGGAALLAAAIAARRRMRALAGDPPDREYADARMEENATGEGMPERDG